MTRRWMACLAGLALVTAVLACDPSGSGGQSVSGRATSLAQTAAAVLTGTADASITPETPTPPPAETAAAGAATAAATAGRASVTSAPTRPASPPSATQTPCPNEKADFVTDVNVPDGTHFAPGAAFQKTWRLRNSGDCAWTAAYTVRNVGGELMGGATTNLPNDVPPGATVDLTVSLVAPNNPGKYTSHWQLFTPAGVAFGTKPYVQITVP